MQQPHCIGGGSSPWPHCTCRIAGLCLSSAPGLGMPASSTPPSSSLLSAALRALWLYLLYACRGANAAGSQTEQPTHKPQVVVVRGVVISWFSGLVRCHPCNCQDGAPDRGDAGIAAARMGSQPQDNAVTVTSQAAVSVRGVYQGMHQLKAHSSEMSPCCQTPDNPALHGTHVQREALGRVCAAT